MPEDGGREAPKPANRATWVMIKIKKSLATSKNIQALRKVFVRKRGNGCG